MEAKKPSLCFNVERRVALLCLVPFHFMCFPLSASLPLRLAALVCLRSVWGRLRGLPVFECFCCLCMVCRVVIHDDGRHKCSQHFTHFCVRQLLEFGVACVTSSLMSVCFMCVCDRTAPSSRADRLWGCFLVWGST